MCNAAGDVIKHGQCLTGNRKDISLEPEHLNSVFFKLCEYTHKKTPLTNLLYTELLMNGPAAKADVFNWQCVCPDGIVDIVTILSKLKSIHVSWSLNNIIKKNYL